MMFPCNHTFAPTHKLQKIAQVFNPFSTPFLRKHLRHYNDPILDLGCGQGYSTQMLAMAGRSNEVYGMDGSCDHITAAMDKFNQCVFIRHDLKKTPLPVRAGLMYSRFILGHLPDPLRTVGRWFDELPAGGKMIIEEIESIDAAIDVFRKYIAVNQWVMAYHNASFFVGEILGGATYERATVRMNECVPFPVSNHDAALMFRLNIEKTLMRKDFAGSALLLDELEKLSGQLKEIIDSRDGNSDITWNMRRMVLEKAG